MHGKLLKFIFRGSAWRGFSRYKFFDKFGLLIVPYTRVRLSNKALQLYVIVIPQLIISCHVVPVLI